MFPSLHIYYRLASTSCRRFHQIPRRYASLTSAIERGRRRANAAIDREWGGSTTQDQENHTGARKGGLSMRREHGAYPYRNWAETTAQEPADKRTNYINDRQERTQLPKSQGQTAIGKSRLAPGVPISIPYTTSASVFLYGRFSVLAALKAKRRKFYKLYVLKGDDTDTERIADVENVARSSRIWIEHVGPHWAGVLNKMAEGRPHNGVVLEASPLPKLPVRALKTVTKMSDPIAVHLDNMSEEDFEVTGGGSLIPRKNSARHYPLVLLLDRVLDPGNLGAIIRSAYFLGVDAVVMSRSGSAPTSAVTVKASAGAAEAMPLLTANAPLDFVKKSKSEGWQVFAAVSPSSYTGRQRLEKFVRPENALQLGPCLLVIGGEGEGIARALMKEITGYVGIPQVSRDDGLDVVESLNVSVATAMMVQQFLSSRGSIQNAVHQSSTKDDVKPHDAVF